MDLKGLWNSNPTVARRRENIHAILYHLLSCHARKCQSPKALCYQSHPSPPRGTYARWHSILLTLLIFAVGSLSRLHYQSTHWGESFPYNPIAGGVWQPFICTELEGGKVVSYPPKSTAHPVSLITSVETMHTYSKPDLSLIALAIKPFLKIFLKSDLYLLVTFVGLHFLLLNGPCCIVCFILIVFIFLFFCIIKHTGQLVLCWLCYRNKIDIDVTLNMLKIYAPFSDRWGRKVYLISDSPIFLGDGHFECFFFYFLE